MKGNIENIDVLCKEPISEESQYCFDCKLSTCDKCTLIEHKDHNYVNKYPYYAYPSNIDEANDYIKLLYENKDKKVKQNLT